MIPISALTSGLPPYYNMLNSMFMKLSKQLIQLRKHMQPVRITLFFLMSNITMLQQNAKAQQNGILAFTGCRYFQEGITVKEISVKTDGAYLLSNTLNLNKELEFSFSAAAGFAEDRAKLVFAGAEITVTGSKGAVLYKIPNYFKDLEQKGIQPAGAKLLQVKVPLRQEVIKTETSCLVQIRLFDLRSKKQLRVELPVIIARPGEQMQLSKTLNQVKGDGVISAGSSIVKIRQMDVAIDTGIRVSPKMAYLSLDMKAIEGTSMTELLSGKESFWVYDNNLVEIKIPDKQLKQVKGSMEDNLADYLSKIPFRLKSHAGKTFFIRFRWVSTDRKKVIDIVVNR